MTERCEHEFQKNLEGEEVEMLVGPQVIYNTVVLGIPSFHLMEGRIKRCTKCGEATLRLEKWEHLKLVDSATDLG